MSFAWFEKSIALATTHTFADGSKDGRMHIECPCNEENVYAQLAQATIHTSSLITNRHAWTVSAACMPDAMTFGIALSKCHVPDDRRSIC